LASCLSTGGHSVRDALAERLDTMRRDHESAMSLVDEETGTFDEDLAQRSGVPTREVIRAARAEVWEKSASTLARI